MFCPPCHRRSPRQESRGPSTDPTSSCSAAIVGTSGGPDLPSYPRGRNAIPGRDSQVAQGAEAVAARPPLECTRRWLVRAPVSAFNERDLVRLLDGASLPPGSGARPHGNLDEAAKARVERLADDLLELAVLYETAAEADRSHREDETAVARVVVRHLRCVVPQ